MASSNASVALFFRPLRAWLQAHHNFLFLLLAFTVFRLLALVVLRPGGYVVDQGPDQHYYFDISRLSGSGQWPFFDFWMEYPPLMPWLAAIAYQLSLHIPVWDTPIFWFNLIFRLFLLPFDVATLALIYLIVRQFDTPERAWQIAGLWALLFAPFFALLTWFDPLTLFFLVLGLYGLLSQRPLLAGAAIGLGFMAKVLPVAIAPLGLFTLGNNRRRLLYVGSAAVAAGLVILPPLLVAPAYVAAMFRALLDVSAWETVWALLEGYTGYGLVAPLAWRHDPAAAAFSAHPATLPWPLISLGFALLYLFLLTRRIDWGDKRRVALFALFSLTLFILHSKGYSPQWAAYLSTLALLALPTGRGLGYGLLLTLFMIAEWPFAFIVMAGHDWFLAAVIILRTCVIFLLGLDALARALPETAVWRVGRRLAFPLALLVSLSGVFLTAAPAWRAYAGARLAGDPLSPFVAMVQAAGSVSAPIIVLQPELLERLHPHLPDHDAYLLPNVSGNPWISPDQWLPGTLAQRDHFWLLFENSDETDRPLFDTVRTWLDDHTCPALQTWYGTVWAGHYVVAPPANPQRIETPIADGLRLQAATLPDGPLTPGAAFCLRLWWQADAAPGRDYAIFVHLLDAQGQLVEQSDSWPATPTSAWSPGATVPTEHGLVIPLNLTPGTYALQVGLYETGSGRRLLQVDGRDALRLTDILVLEHAQR